MRVSLSVKLIGGFTFAAIGIVFAAILSIFQMNAINQNVNLLAQKIAPSIYNAGKIDLTIGHYRRQ